MLSRQIKFLSEEWRAVLFLNDVAEQTTGTRPSANESIGKAVVEKAAALGYTTLPNYREAKR